MADERAEGAAVLACLDTVRRHAPLVHNITNIVVANLTANALLAIGASPAMVDGLEEVEEFVAKADALVVNLGTLSGPLAAAMKLAAAGAARANVPWVLDPVAVGVLGYRTGLAAELLGHAPAAIRGNPAEIMALAGEAGRARGVDSLIDAAAATGAAVALARRTGAVVAATGAVDVVTDGALSVEIANGHPLMGRVTGMGCTATALVGAFLAVEPDRLRATAAALLVLGVAGELAAARAPGPGSFAVAVLDALHELDAAGLAERARLRFGPATRGAEPG